MEVHLTPEQLVKLEEFRRNDEIRYRCLDPRTPCWGGWQPKLPERCMYCGGLVEAWPMLRN